MRKKGEEKQKQAGVLYGEGHPKEVLSQNDKSSPAHNTQKEIAKSAGISTGQVGMAEQVRKKAPELWDKAKEGA